MTIDTRVFRRIMDEHRQAGLNSTFETMKETTRFGLFPEPYIQQCAEDRYDTELEKLQKA